jgi:hypothetical protein
MKNHYDWLDENFNHFLNAISVKEPKYYMGLISAHGDKCYSYRDQWEKHGIPFEKGVAIYLASYIYPWSKTVRNTEEGWIAPDKWVMSMWDNGWSEYFD